MGKVEGIAALIAVLGLTVIVGQVVRLVVRYASGAPYQPSEPGPWPTGVEEDDDARWSWRNH